MSRSQYRKSFAVLFTVVCLLALTGLAAGQTIGAPRIHERPGTQPTITLQPMLVPTVGTQAAFFITGASFTEVAGRSGFFVFAPLSELEQESYSAVRARYTVLTADQGTGNPRVLVQAQPVDPETWDALGRTRWEAVYLITPEGAKWQEGSSIPAEYEDLVTPSWLTKWTIAPYEDLPKGALRPGTEWQAMPELELEDVPFGDTPLPMIGAFTGWVDLPYSLGAGAHISENLAGTGESVSELSEGLPAIVTFDIEGNSDYWLIPNDFPFGLEQSITGAMRITLGPESGAPAGVEGHLEYAFYYGQSVDWDPYVDIEWLEPVDDGTIWPGEPVAGALGPWSDSLYDGTLIDVYTFHGNANDVVEIFLGSDEFDAYVFLLADNEDTLAMDNDSGGGTDALIRYILPYTGDYFVMANSLMAGETGNYVLALDITGKFDWQRAVQLISRLQTPELLSDQELLEVEATLVQLWEQVQNNLYIR